MSRARPFAKSVGGKTSLLPELLKRVPKTFENYYEPFIGGGALFFALANDRGFHHAVINDLNPNLYAAWRMVQVAPDKLIQKLKKFKNDQDFFMKVRKRDSSKMEILDLAAWFLYLNKTSFNGLWRVNKKGFFNVPFAHYKNPNICDEDNIRACHKALRGVEILSLDFEDAVSNVASGDFAYFDPPYSDRTANFVAYTKEGFGSEDQKRLRDCLRRLKKLGVSILASNSDTEEVRSLYGKGFKIEEVAGRRSVGATAERRGFIGDVLIS